MLNQRISQNPKNLETDSESLAAVGVSAEKTANHGVSPEGSQSVEKEKTQENTQTVPQQKSVVESTATALFDPPATDQQGEDIFTKDYQQLTPEEIKLAKKSKVGTTNHWFGLMGERYQKKGGKVTIQ